MPSSPRRCRGPLVLLLLLGAAGLAHGAHVRAATARPGGADPYAHHKVKRYYQSWHDPTAPFALAETAASAWRWSRRSSPGWIGGREFAAAKTCCKG